MCRIRVFTGIMPLNHDPSQPTAPAICSKREQTVYLTHKDGNVTYLKPILPYLVYNENFRTRHLTSSNLFQPLTPDHACSTLDTITCAIYTGLQRQTLRHQHLITLIRPYYRQDRQPDHLNRRLGLQRIRHPPLLHHRKPGPSSQKPNKTSVSPYTDVYADLFSNKSVSVPLLGPLLLAGRGRLQHWQRLGDRQLRHGCSERRFADEQTLCD